MRSMLLCCLLLLNSSAAVAANNFTFTLLPAAPKHTDTLSVKVNLPANSCSSLDETSVQLAPPSGGVAQVKIFLSDVCHANLPAQSRTFELGTLPPHTWPIEFRLCGAMAPQGPCELIETQMLEVASGAAISFDPPTPQAGQPVMAELDVGARCSSGVPHVQRIGQTVVVTANLNGVCMLPPDAYYQAQLGAFSPGTYVVRLRTCDVPPPPADPALGCETLTERTLSVGAAATRRSTIPTLSISMLVLTPFLLLLSVLLIPTRRR